MFQVSFKIRTAGQESSQGTATISLSDLKRLSDKDQTAHHTTLTLHPY